MPGLAADTEHLTARKGDQRREFERSGSADVVVSVGLPATGPEGSAQAMEV